MTSQSNFLRFFEIKAIARKIRVMTLPYLHAGFQQVKNTRA